MTDPCAPNAHRFTPLGADPAAAWTEFPEFGGEYFANHIGLRLEELREDYARLRLPFARFLAQPAGVVHGGAIASLIDTVVVPAVGWKYERGTAVFATINMQIDFLRPVVDTDVIAEGWVVRRGRSVVFCRSEVRRRPDGELVATGSLAYSVRTIEPGV